MMMGKFSLPVTPCFMHIYNPLRNDMLTGKYFLGKMCVPWRGFIEKNVTFAYVFLTTYLIINRKKMGKVIFSAFSLKGIHCFGY